MLHMPYHTIGGTFLKKEFIHGQEEKDLLISCGVTMEFFEKRVNVTLKDVV